MIKVAITGNIASGKSTVEKILKSLGYKVLDTDEVSHELLTVKNELLYEAFKDFDVFENGEFSRYKVGQFIFANEQKRKKLEEILHPQVGKKMLEFFEINKSEEVVFVGIPLLFEASMQSMFDKIIFIFTDDKIRLERLLKRDGYTEEYAKRRMASQIPQEEKAKLSDFVMYNNGNIEELEIQVSKILSEI